MAANRDTGRALSNWHLYADDAEPDRVIVSHVGRYESLAESLATIDPLTLSRPKNWIQQFREWRCSRGRLPLQPRLHRRLPPSDRRRRRCRRWRAC